MVDSRGVGVVTLGCEVLSVGGVVVPACGLAEHKVGEGVPEDAHLSCVGVPAESQGYRRLVHNLRHPLRGVMRKQQAEAVCALQCLREAAAVDCAETLSVAGRVVHTHDGEGLYICGVAALAGECKMLIAQELPAEGVALEGGEAFHLGEALLLGEA